MDKFKFVMIPCERCGKNHSMLSKFVFGEEMKSVLDVYGKICPSCLTEEEKSTILSCQYSTMMNPINNSHIGGGTGCGYIFRVIQNLGKYLQGIE